MVATKNGGPVDIHGVKVTFAHFPFLCASHSLITSNSMKARVYSRCNVQTKNLRRLVKGSPALFCFMVLGIKPI